MRIFFSGLFYKWLALTFSYIAAFRAFDYIFGVSTIFSFADAGFVAFVNLWCAKQDKIKKEGKRHERTQR